MDRQNNKKRTQLVKCLLYVMRGNCLLWKYISGFNALYFYMYFEDTVRNMDDLLLQQWGERGRARQKSYREQKEKGHSSLINAMCFRKAVHNLGSLYVGWRRFPHLAGQFKEKLSEVTSTIEVREHCTCFCWQGFYHALVATLSSLCWPNTVNMPLCRLCLFRYLFCCPYLSTFSGGIQE